MKSLLILSLTTLCSFAADPLPSWNDTAPKKAVIAFVEKALPEMAMATHAGMTTEEFDQIANDWITTAKHPKTGKL